jgi:hypothetical protein
MSIRSKVIAAAAALTILGGVSTVSAMTASTAGAATPSCGTRCLDVFSKQFGTQFYLDTFRQGEKTGQPIILFRESNADPALDFTVSFQGDVSDFFAAGMVSSAVMIHYGCKAGDQITNPGGQGGTLTCGPNAADLPAGELEYAPFGVESGLCVGVAGKSLPATGTAHVTLQPCGTGAGTVWILDLLDASGTNCSLSFANDDPLINGLDSNFSLPSVLTYPANGFPTDKPRPQLEVANLTGFSQNGPPSPNPSGCVSITGPDTDQLWSAGLGILP